MPAGANAGPWRESAAQPSGISANTYPIPSPVRLGLADVLTDVLILKLMGGMFSHESRKHSKRRTFRTIGSSYARVDTLRP